MLLKESKGMLFSTEFLLTIILLVLIIGIIANLMDRTDEKILNSMKTNNLESYSSKVADSLINSPGSPENWEKLSSFNNVIPGLSLQNENKETILNTISFKKIKILTSNYDTLITKNIFNNEIKSSIAIYPFNTEIEPIIIGEEINNQEHSTVFIVNRTVKCDFLSELAIISFNNENYNEDYLNSLCNHDSLNNFSHESTENYLWICNEFKVKRKDLDYNDYYLIFDEESINIGGLWILDNTKRISTAENHINNVKIDLNSYLEENLENNSELIFYLHCKVPSNNKNKLNYVLVAIPKEMEVDNLNFPYFISQTCQFILKTTYY
ncbi:MAG: hypothetical protein FWH29_02180 [Methanobrevibacter sp.]|nr:hypothetical protein [Methanobrevibacter sp.]